MHNNSRHTFSSHKINDHPSLAIYSNISSNIFQSNPQTDHWHPIVWWTSVVTDLHKDMDDN
jgi:hypothetical protein